MYFICLTQATHLIQLIHLERLKKTESWSLLYDKPVSGFPLRNLIFELVGKLKQVIFEMIFGDKALNNN